MLFQWDLTNKNIHELYINLTEMEFAKQLKHVVEYITISHSIKILSIAGPTSAGKTTTAKKISEKLLEYKNINSKTISMDNFYKNIEEIPLKSNGNPDLEAIEAIDVTFLLNCIDEIIAKGKTQIPIFDFTVGARKSNYSTLELRENEILIIEGIHGLNPIITEKFTNNIFKSIYITIAENLILPGGTTFFKRDIRFLRRLIRDFKHRSASPNFTFELWENVCESENVHIFPYENFADIMINSFHSYELCVIKNQAVLLLQQIDFKNKYYEDAQKLLIKLEKIPTIDENLVPTNSLLREFL